MITKTLAKTVLDTALSTGADFAEIFAENTHINSLTLDNGEIVTASSNIVSGVGVRVLKQLQSVYGYTNDISAKSLTKLADDLAHCFEGERAIAVGDIRKQTQGKRNRSKIAWNTVSNERKTELLRTAYQVCKEYDPRIVRVEVSLSDSTSEVEIFNSDGKLFTDVRSRGRLFITVYASEDGKMEIGNAGPGAQKGFEYFTDEIDVKAVALMASKQAITKLNADECPSGKMDVVMGNGFGGVIFHEACGHALEASAVSKNMSVFSGKLGQKIASDVVTALDDGTIDGGWGSGNVDDEGNQTQCNVLIKDGILQSYLIDKFNGRRMGAEANGASRRQSYKFEPTSRMSNTFIAAGNSTPEEIIAATEKGLYAKSMGGGSVNPVTGEFNFAVNEAYLIENGKIGKPVKGATLIGKGSEILLNIDMVGNDLLRAQGMCGAASGSIPADVGQPTIRVRNITVGGRGGSIQ